MVGPVEQWLRIGGSVEQCVVSKDQYFKPDAISFRKPEEGIDQWGGKNKWKGSKARNIGGGFKLFYGGVDGKRNGVGVFQEKEFSQSVVEMKRVSNRVMNMKLEVEGVMINVISAYTPKVVCKMKEKEKFWSELNEMVKSELWKERLVIGGDFNGHVGEGKKGDEEVIGRYGLKERNVEGQMMVDFAKRMKMAVVYAFFKK
ncbi:hypothetical protein C0J45_19009 [Silurus meridionalis]|nr:hypothetical protein C0J45_19009 [Silurus meridionalis]